MDVRIQHRLVERFSTIPRRLRGATLGGWLYAEGKWLLITGVAVLAMIGFLHLTRGTAVRHVRGIGANPIPSVESPEFPLTVTLHTGAWIADGNRVEVALNGDGTYDRMWNDLRSAQRSITLQVYYGQSGRMAETLGRILLERARAGVRVYVLFDAFGAQDVPADHVAMMALNNEATLMVLDRTLARQMDRIFLDDLAHAREITAAEFGRRSWFQRGAENAANAIMRLL